MNYLVFSFSKLRLIAEKGETTLEIESKSSETTKDGLQTTKAAIETTIAGLHATNAVLETTNTCLQTTKAAFFILSTYTYPQKIYRNDNQHNHKYKKQPEQAAHV